MNNFINTSGTQGQKRLTETEVGNYCLRHQLLKKRHNKARKYISTQQAILRFLSRMF